MTNPRVPQQKDQTSAADLRPLVQALDLLIDDQGSFPLSLPERTVAEIQRVCTINALIRAGITNDAAS